MGKYRVSLRLGDLGYLHYEEENEDVFKRKLKTISELRDAVLSTLSKKGLSEVVSQEYPNIVQPANVPDAIEKLLSTDWGKDPRTLDELHSALAVNAVHVRKETLGSRLTTMTKKNRLTRVKRGRVYAYSLPLQRRL